MSYEQCTVQSATNYKQKGSRKKCNEIMLYKLENFVYYIPLKNTYFNSFKCNCEVAKMAILTAYCLVTP